MIEALVALLALASALLVVSVPWTLLLEIGVALTVLGMAIGVPAGAWYHVRLYVELAQHPPLPPRWWLSPIRYHGRLEDTELERVLPSFYLGGAGFVLTALGCGIATLGCLAVWLGASR